MISDFFIGDRFRYAGTRPQKYYTLFYRSVPLFLILFMYISTTAYVYLQCIGFPDLSVPRAGLFWKFGLR